jgi:hypothetical protein
MSRLVWAATTAVRVGDYHIGVRSSTPAVREALEAALNTHVVEDPRAPASHAIHVPTDLAPGARPVYRVFEECTPVFVTSSLTRAIGVLAGYLADYLPRPSVTSSTVDLDAAALIQGVAAVVVPWQIPYLEPGTEQRLRRSGSRILESRRVRVDTATAEIVVPPSPLISAGPLSGTDAATGPGRYRCRGWIFLGRRQAHAPFTRAQALAHAMALAYRPTTASANLPVLASLLSKVQIGLASDVADTIRQTTGLLEPQR